MGAAASAAGRRFALRFPYQTDRGQTLDVRGESTADWKGDAEDYPTERVRPDLQVPFGVLV